MPIYYYGSGSPNSTETSKLDIVLVSTSPYIAIGAGKFHECDCTSVAITFNLPSAIGLTGEQIIVKKMDNVESNTLTITPQNGENINGNLSLIIVYQNSSVTLVSDGFNWQVI